MGLFNIFGKKNDESKVMSISLPNAEPAEAKAEVENVAVTQEDKHNEEKPLTVSYATGWPIDVIYGYLHKSYENKGFDDAMLKSDLTFRDLNMNLIKNKILMVFREVNLNYDVMKQDMQTRIDNCNAAGLLTTVSELEKNLATINSHKEELRQLEVDFRNNANEASIPLQSYNCGFLRGIASIQIGGASRSVNTPVMGSKSSMALNTAIA